MQSWSWDERPRTRFHFSRLLLLALPSRRSFGLVYYFSSSSRLILILFTTLNLTLLRVCVCVPFFNCLFLAVPAEPIHSLISKENQLVLAVLPFLLKKYLLHTPVIDCVPCRNKTTLPRLIPSLQESIVSTTKTSPLNFYPAGFSAAPFYSKSRQVCAYFFQLTTTDI